MALNEEIMELDKQKRDLELARKDFYRKVEIEERRIERESDLFSMKFRILEEELLKLAAEREKMEKRKEFYRKVEEFSKKERENENVFFRGITTIDALKKRYKALVKIYHPDNIDGDNSTVLEINKEYNYLNGILR